MPTIGHIVEQRQNEVGYIILDSIDPSAIEDEVHDLLLQAIQDTHLVGYHPFSSLHIPELITPPPMQADTFPNWEAGLYILDTPLYLSLEQLPEVAVAKGLGQREVENKEDLIFRAREHYQTPTPISRR